jgi:hypothetical protein
VMVISWNCFNNLQTVSIYRLNKPYYILMKHLENDAAEMEEATTTTPEITKNEDGKPVLPKILHSYSLDTRKGLVRDFVKAVRGTHPSH